MSSFTITYPDLQDNGPILEVEIAIPKDLAKILKKLNEPVPSSIKAMALIDTGASRTVVNPDIIRRLNLAPIGQTTICTASHAYIDAYQYKLSFTLPEGIIVELSDVVELPLDGQAMMCLLGRDILQRGVFIYNGITRQVTFTV